MLTFLIKPPGHKPYTKCLPSNAAAMQDAQRRFPGSAPASVVNLCMTTGHAEFLPACSQTRRLFIVAARQEGRA